MEIRITIQKDKGAEIYRDYIVQDSEEMCWGWVVRSMIDDLKNAELDTRKADEEKEMARMDAEDQRKEVLNNFN
jgi:hypothetical protein